MAKKNDLQAKTAVELQDMAAGLKKELFDLHFKHSTRALNDTMAIRRARRQIARVLTAAKLKSTNP